MTYAAMSTYLSVAQAAAALGVSKSTVLRRIHSGEWAAMKLGGETSAWVMTADEVAAIKAAS